MSNERINLFLPSHIKTRMDIIAEDLEVPTKLLVMSCLEKGIELLDHPMRARVLKDVQQWIEKTADKFQ